MSYTTHYERYKELCAEYSIRRGTYNILSPMQKAELPIDEQKKIINAELEKYDVVVEYAGASYACMRYRVLQNKPNLNARDLAIICDEGNLCFGYRTQDGLVVVYTD